MKKIIFYLKLFLILACFFIIYNKVNFYYSKYIIILALLPLSMLSKKINILYYEDDLVTVNNNSFTREGYSFVQWNEKADGTGKSYTPGDTFNMPSGNVTL